MRSTAELLDGLALALALAGLGTFVGRATLEVRLADLELQVAERQRELAEAEVVSQVNGRLIRMLAKAAAERNDAALRDLLARHGVTFTVAPAPVGAGRPVAAPDGEP